MSFTSLPFLVLVGLSVAVYYLLPQRVQWMVLLAASMVFYCVGGGRTVLYVFYTAATVYVAGRLLGRFALPLSGLLLIALGVWQVLGG